jgi:hypothetical protein
MEMIHEHMTTFAMVQIDSYKVASIKCRFHYEWKMGTMIYMSFPYVLVFDGNSCKMYTLEGKQIFKKLIPMGTFVDDQCKVLEPTYFSPNFMHRIYINDNKEIVVNHTLTNYDVITLDFKKKIMFQKKKTHPMIYFHNNDQIVYLSRAGVEKLFNFVKVPGKLKGVDNCYLEEVSNIAYNEKQLARRFKMDK